MCSKVWGKRMDIVESHGPEVYIYTGHKKVKGNQKMGGRIRKFLIIGIWDRVGVKKRKESRF